MRLVTLAAIGLLLLTGCGTDTAPTSSGASDTSDSPTPTEQHSLLIADVEKVRDPGPNRLRPGDQLVTNDQGYEVYTALWTKPHYGPGNST